MPEYNTLTLDRFFYLLFTHANANFTYMHILIIYYKHVCTCEYIYI